VILRTFIFGSKIRVVLDGGILGTLDIELKTGVAFSKTSKN